MRVAFAVLMTAVAALKLKDEGSEEVACADLELDLENVDWENVDWEDINWDDIPDCCNDEDGNKVCLEDLSWGDLSLDDLSLSDLSLDTDLLG